MISNSKTMTFREAWDVMVVPTVFALMFIALGVGLSFVLTWLGGLP